MFLFLVALELTRELVPGEPNNPRMAALPIAAALGGMLVPATLYLVLQWGQAPMTHGTGFRQIQYINPVLRWTRRIQDRRKI